MAGFPTMNKSKVDYEAELEKFDWSAARKKIELPLNPAGVTKAKQLIEEATAARLSKAYAKVGIVKGDLVFRIKYGSDKHYGKGDIVLIGDYETAAAAPDLSKRSKNQGELELSDEKNPVSRKWWRETLGSANDPAHFDALLVRYEDAVAEMDKAHSRQNFEDVKESLRRLTDGQRALQHHFTAENDQRILAKLEAGLKATDIYLHGKHEKYEVRLKQACGALGTRIESRSDNYVASLTQMLKDITQLARAGDDVTRMANELEKAEQYLQEALDYLDDPFRRDPELHATPDGIHVDDYTIRSFAPIVARWQPKVEALRAPLEQSSRQHVLGAADPAIVRDIKKMQGNFDMLKKNLTILTQLADNAEAMAANYGHATIGNRDYTQTITYAKQGLEDWTKIFTQFQDELATLEQRCGPNDKNAIGSVRKLRTNGNSMMLICDQALAAKLAQAEERMAQKPRVVAETLQEAREVLARAREYQQRAKDIGLVLALTPEERTQQKNQLVTIQSNLSSLLIATTSIGGVTTKVLVPWVKMLTEGSPAAKEGGEIEVEIRAILDEVNKMIDAG